MSIRLKATIEWFDELVTNEKRDERELFSLWQSLKAQIESLEKKQTESKKEAEKR